MPPLNPMVCQVAPPSTLCWSGAVWSCSDWGCAYSTSWPAPSTAIDGVPLCHPVAGEREATYAQWSIDRLVRRGVPREAVVPTFAGDSTSTDASGVRAMAEARGWTTLVVVTDDWHSRRAQLVFARVFNGSPIRYYLSPANGPRFDPEAWWLDETSALNDVGREGTVAARTVPRHR